MSNMAEIKTSVIINSTQEKIWDVISDIDNEPKFWKGTKEVRNISKGENQISREITIAFRDQKCLQEVTIIPKETIRAVFTKGVIVGEKILTLKKVNDSCELEADLGCKTFWYDGNVYWNDKKTYQKWNRTSITSN